MPVCNQHNIFSVTKLQELTDGKTESPTASPVPGGRGRKKHDRKRSKSALGENVKTIISDIQKEDAAKR